jgi:hypothetical protein
MLLIDHYQTIELFFNPRRRWPFLGSNGHFLRKVNDPPDGESFADE